MTQLDIMSAAAALPAININALQGLSKTRDPRAAWMLAGWVIACLLLMLALVREIGDRALASMSDHQRLRRVGLTNPEIQATYRWSLLPPLAVSIPIGFIGAVVFSLLGYELGVTIDNVLRISVVSVAAAAASAVTIALVFRIQKALTPD
jgi:hypothetical protein